MRVCYARRVRIPKALVLSLVVACGAPAATTAPRPEAAAPAAGSAPSTPSSAAAPSEAAATHADAASAFARLRGAFAACLEEGRRTTPSMRDGRVTLHASVDASGRASCVVPSDAMGITADVQDCMAQRVGSERFTPPGASLRVPLALRGGELALAEEKATSLALSSVETRRMPDAFDVLEELLPKMQACVEKSDPAGRPKSLLVAARVASDGRPTCALTATNETSSPALSECTTGVLRTATFPPPKGGPGLVLVPIQLSRP